jgi:hypothetical protein
MHSLMFQEGYRIPHELRSLIGTMGRLAYTTKKGVAFGDDSRRCMVVGIDWENKLIVLVEREAAPRVVSREQYKADPPRRKYKPRYSAGNPPWVQRTDPRNSFRRVHPNKRAA